MIYTPWFPVIVATALLALLAISNQLGFRYGFRRAARTEAEPGQTATIQAAVLGLLGLILGFSFAGASARLIERQDLIVREANAIGTLYLRADLLQDAFAHPSREVLRAALVEYRDARIELFLAIAPEPEAKAVAHAERLHSIMWEAVTSAGRKHPALVNLLVPPTNELIDLHATRLASMHRHQPPIVMGTLVICACVAMALVGYGCGLARKPHRTLTAVLAALVGAVLWITIDLDFPRRGVTIISNAPMESLTFPAGRRPAE